MSRTACLALALALAGCAVGPDYRRPELPLPERFADTPSAALSGGEAEAVQRVQAGADLPAQWWALFESPALDGLVRTALAQNPSVAAAHAALRAARENVRAQQSAFFPSADLGYSGTRQRIPEALASPAASNASIYSLHTAQVSVSYAPDLFGGNLRQVESLRGQADGQRWAAEATYLTLTSNLVQAAVLESSLRAQLQAVQRIVGIQRELLTRFQRLQALGQVAELDVAQQAASLADAEAQLPPLQTQLAQQRDLLKALCGRLPTDTLDAEFDADSFKLPQSLPLTLPSSLALHRPDVLAAEAQLRSASAAIGVAAANRLPSVSLGVNAWGSSALTLADLFRSATGFWTLAGSASQTVFDAGALKHREAAARALYDQAQAQYKSTVITAFQNVADTLQALAGDADALAAARRAQVAAERSLAIARRQLALGDASTLAVMQAEQSALQSSLAVVQARSARLTDTAALFQALGGGWWNRPEAAIPSASR